MRNMGVARLASSSRARISGRLFGAPGVPSGSSTIGQGRAFAAPRARADHRETRLLGRGGASHAVAMGDLGIDTEVRAVGDGRYEATLSREWEIWGPMGGYVAAFALRAAGASSPFDRPATFSCHFL